jgi:hypothetical protein
MSYCRFSDDDFGCDAYIYESVDGFMMHLAATRLEQPLPPTAHLLPNGSAKSSVDAWQRYFRARAENSLRLAQAVQVPIEHDDAGKTFRFDDTDDLLRKVIEIKSNGFRVPDYVVTTLREEILEGNVNADSAA